MYLNVVENISEFLSSWFTRQILSILSSPSWHICLFRLQTYFLLRIMLGFRSLPIWVLPYPFSYCVINITHWACFPSPSLCYDCYDYLLYPIHVDFYNWNSIWNQLYHWCWFLVFIWNIYGIWIDTSMFSSII